VIRVLVTGAAGQLGAAILRGLEGAYDVTGLTRAGLDITSPDAVADLVGRLKPALIVNCAAYNAVDGAEDEPVAALRANAFAVRSMARAAGAVGATLVHYSTDFVFDGKHDTPYVETDPPNPRSTYAVSKLLGEWFAELAPKAYVLRVESLFGVVEGGPAPRGTVAAIVDGLEAGRVVRAFEDRIVSPSSVVDVARATRALVERRAAPGLYHCVNSGRCTWVELAREAARLIGVEPRLEIVRQADVALRAERPQYCALSNGKLAAAGIAMPSWQDALAAYVRARQVRRV
jgi:dTDP-4-dehydrorhamnose reductase